MPAKRPLDDPEALAAEPKKARHGFRVGPANLPDGPWRRKGKKGFYFCFVTFYALVDSNVSQNLVDRVKRDLIEKAKVKKQYSKIKARQEQEQLPSGPKLGPVVHLPENGPQDGSPTPDADATEQAQPQIHPQRQAMLEGDDDDAAADAQQHHRGTGDNYSRRRGRKRPRGGGGYEKELAEAAKKKQEAEERAAERARREEERNRKTAERERHRRAMAKARTPGRNGQRKLGRESFVLLDKVKKMVG